MIEVTGTWPMGMKRNVWSSLACLTLTSNVKLDTASDNEVPGEMTWEESPWSAQEDKGEGAASCLRRILLNESSFDLLLWIGDSRGVWWFDCRGKSKVNTKDG